MIMNLQFKYRINNSTSVTETTKLLHTLGEQITKLMSPKLTDCLKESPIPLVITLVANPHAEELEGSFNHKNGIYSIVSKKIESDINIYTFRNKLGRIDLLSHTDIFLVAIGLEEYKFVLEQNDKDEEDDKPVFEVKNPKWDLEDVLLPDDIKIRINRAIAIIEHKDLIFNKWGFSKIDKATKSIICFYGPAGTGKTMTAEAIASRLNKKIVHSSYAEIESKWVGEGAKNLHAIFSFAEENDAVLFFDEADSFLSSRIQTTESSSDKHYNRMSNELFQLLEEFNGCVIFATNLLTDVDAAFKSRIIDSIKFALPDSDARITLIKKMIPREFPLTELDDNQYKILAEISDGFSGRDIRKSVLLSLAGAATIYSQNNVFVFSFNDLKEGFEEVKNSRDMMNAENGILPNDITEELLQNQKRNENLIDIALYAMHSDGILNESEKTIIREFSKTLLGIEENSFALPEKGLSVICEEAKQGGYAKDLLDTAIRVIAVDGIFTPTEKDFIQSILSAMNTEIDTDDFFEYCQNMANSYKYWSNVVI